MPFFKPSLLVGLILLVTSPIFGQVGIGTSSPSPSAQLEVRSTNKGFLPPSVALQGTNDAQLASPTIASPATGLLVYNSAPAGSGATAVTPGFYYYSGSAWVRLIVPTDNVANVTGLVAVPNGGTGTTTGSITGTGALTFTAGGSNQNVTLTPSGTGSTILNGRVSIGANTGQNPNATLEITGTPSNVAIPDGIVIPRITRAQLIAKTAYGTSQIGAMIYVTDLSGTINSSTVNVTYAGYYYFDGSVWQRLVNSNTQTTSSSIDPNITGYIPSSTANATNNAPATYSIPAGSGGVSRTATRSGLATFTNNGHSYAAYSTNGNITWYQAYEAAKAMGGYLATFTSDAEWQFVETNLLNATIFNTNGAWIGFTKYTWEGAGGALTPDPEMKWITGEQPIHDYSAGTTSAVRKSNWFNSGEPNNNGGNEGFVHTWAKNSNYTRTYNGYTSTHPWNDVSANSSPQNSSWGFIVEFNQ